MGDMGPESLSNGGLAGPLEELVCILARTEGDAQRSGDRTGAVVFLSYDAFVASGLNPGVFLVVSADNAWVTQAVMQLRRDRLHGDKPLYIASSGTTVVNCLVDGLVRNAADARQAAAVVESLGSELPARANVVTQDHRLLRFLYERPDFVISPHKDWHAIRAYGYPLLACMQLQGADEERWLHTLLARGLIEPVALIDRLRECPKCNSAHVVFVDVCPNCQSLDIEQKPFIHCFTCGSMAPQERCMDKGGLVCPKCSSRLRHIGEDYDRPLENFACNACSQGFIESAVRVRCMCCDAECGVDDLIARPVSSYRLSEHGRVVVRTGGSDELFSVLDQLNHVTPAFFEHMLDWMLKLCERHPDVPFSVISIKLTNVPQLVEKRGRAHVMQLLDAFTVRLRELIRVTDFVSHTTDDSLWVLLAKADEASVDGFLRRLHQLQELTGNDKSAALALKTSSFSAPGQPVKGEVANLLMVRLAAELE